MKEKNNISNYVPAFLSPEVMTLAQQLYGLDNLTVTPLDSYDDQNFLLVDGGGRRFVFKIANRRLSREKLAAQNGAMKHMAAHCPALECPVPVSTATGEDIVRVKGADNAFYLVRLVTYLPGKIMGELESYPLPLLESLGRVLGEMDRALAQFHHPGFYGPSTIWDLKHAPQLEALVGDITDLPRRNLVLYFLRQFNIFAVPLFPDLRTSIIHNDANDYNLLVTGGGTDAGVSVGISGIIDFGDMTHTFTVSEPAIAAAYAIKDRDDPMEAAVRLVAAYHAVYPLTDAELRVLFYFICARLCTTVVMATQQAKEDPDNEYIGISVEPAWGILEKMMKVNPDDAHDRFRRACGLGADTGAVNREPAEIMSLREKYLGKSLSVFYREPLKIVRGAMQYLYDHRGRAYLDTVNNVCHVGHCHPRTVKAIQEQAALLNTNSRFLHDHLAEYARRLCDTLPEPLSVCFLVCTGSEANELALRMARTHTGNRDFIVVDHAYHGNTNGCIEISPYKFDGPGGRGAPPHVHKVMIPDVYRGPYKADDPGVGGAYARDVERVLREGIAPAAFIHESVIGCGGQVVLPPGYLRHVYDRVRGAGGICIADEVQVGFGRVGTHMWGFETQGVVPDIVTLGKPIGNGHPLAAVITTPEIAESFNNGMEYFNTYGGNPVSCAVGLAVLDVIREEGLQENARQVGEYMKQGLRELMDRHPLVGDVRGMGLFLGIELVLDRDTLAPAPEQAHAIMEQMKDAGILTGVDGPLHNVIKIKPPLVFTHGDADFYIRHLDGILDRGL